MTSTPPEASLAENQEFRILTLDGGGVRGLSSLYILQALMEHVNSLRKEVGEKPVKPCQLFDLIGGTSTGGLIAIMLGRLGMDVDECIDVYQKLVKKVFEKPKSSVSRTWASFAQGNIKAKFESSVLRDQIANVVKEKLQVDHPTKVSLYDAARKDDCGVFVCATSHTSTNNTTRLRSYKLHGVFGDIPSTIVDAAQATSAATGFFDPVEIDGELFADGALSANNPAAEAFEELKSIHRLNNNEIEDRICCFVSIGTGHPGLNPISDKFWEMIHKQVISILTETQRTANRFQETHKSLFKTGRAFRFNVMHGMEKVTLDDWNCAKDIKAKTRAYLMEMSNSNDFDQCAKQLVKAVGFRDQLFFQTRRSYYSIASRWRIILWCLLVPIITSYFLMARNASFIEVNAPNYNRQAVLDISLPLFAVLGATGVGKSTFITTLGGRHVSTNELPVIGHRLESQTEQCEIYRFESLATGPGYLIDTPGIDESNRTRTDNEIMNLIQNELERVHIYDKMLTGLVYLYDIRQPRVYGSTLNALDTTINILEYLLGANGVAKITLVTTKWTKEASQAIKKEEERNERMLQDNYWGGPIRCGSTLERYDGTKASGIDILANLRNRKRRMYPEASRCMMSIQTPTQEPVLKPEVDSNQPTWMDTFRFPAWKTSLPASKDNSDRFNWVESIGTRTWWILFLFGDHSAQSDVTGSVLIPPAWLWTPAWIGIASIHRLYLLLMIEERTRAWKWPRPSKYLILACAYYAFGNLRKPEWVDFPQWYVGKASLISQIIVMNAMSLRDNEVKPEHSIRSWAYSCLLVLPSLVHVPLWFPRWATVLGEGLRLALLVIVCLVTLEVVEKRWTNRERHVGEPRNRPTRYEPGQSAAKKPAKGTQETLPKGYKAFPRPATTRIKEITRQTSHDILN